MNFDPGGLRAAGRGLAAVMMVWGLLLPAAHADAITNHPLAGERFLLIVETSSTSQKRAENMQKVVGTILASGLNDHMYPGTTVGMWTFSDNLSAGKFPLQVWTPATRQRVALAAVQFLQPLKHEGPARLAVVLPALTNLLAQSDRLTVILLTAGAEPMTGTPVDAQVAETLRANTDKQRALQMPFITILRATRGAIVAAAVTTPPWSLEIPAYPDLPRDVARRVPPATVVVPETTPPAPDPGMLSPTNIIYLGAEVPTAPEPGVTPRPDVATQIIAGPETTSAPVAMPPPPGLESNLESNLVAPVLAAVAPPPATSTLPRAFPVVPFLIGGIIILLIIMAVFLALLASLRRKQAASLITHSLQRRDR